MLEPTPKYITGAYIIQCQVPFKKKFYVGGAYIDFTERRYMHWWKLRNNSHHNIHLQSAWNKYGEKNFTFKVVERCPPIKEVIQACEQKWIEFFKATDPSYGYNICPNAGSPLGSRRSDESCAQMSRSAKKRADAQYKDPDGPGRKQLAKMLEKSNAVLRGRKRPPEEIENISQGVREAMARPDVKARIAEGQKRRVANPNLARNVRAGQRRKMLKWLNDLPVELVEGIVRSYERHSRSGSIRALSEKYKLPVQFIRKVIRLNTMKNQDKCLFE